MVFPIFLLLFLEANSYCWVLLLLINGDH